MQEHEWLVGVLEDLEEYLLLNDLSKSASELAEATAALVDELELNKRSLYFPFLVSVNDYDENQVESQISRTPGR